jgi:ABC-type polysaccharide/polyol phosphate transport system ATPase subunit
MGNAIEAKKIFKSFKVVHDRSSTIKERVIQFASRSNVEIREILKNVSITVEQGECVGLIGENGSGKSTLLKLLTGIIYPDSGTIEKKGKVSSLLELGAGFHPDMSGLENIYTNASIFGLTKKEIDEKLEEIISFSELEEFIYQPVRTYSSGMYMRLAFSVAIHVEAEILLVDEILAVGDLNFQEKCFNKMQELKEQGVSIIIVSHDLGSIQNICTKCVWLDHGEIKAIGDTAEVISEYLSFMEDKQIQQAKENLLETQEIETTKEVIIDSPRILNEEDKSVQYFSIGDNIIIQFDYHKKNKEIQEIVFGFSIKNELGVQCYETNQYTDGYTSWKLEENGTVEIQLNKVNLLKGKYYVTLYCHDVNGQMYDHIEHSLSFHITTISCDVGIIRISHIWQVI